MVKIVNNFDNIKVVFGKNRYLRVSRYSVSGKGISKSVFNFWKLCTNDYDKKCLKKLELDDDPKLIDIVNAFVKNINKIFPNDISLKEN